MSLQALKNLNTDRILDMDEAVHLSAYARVMETEFEHLEIPVPDWLPKASDVLRQEIARRTHAADLALLKETEQEIDSLKTATERRTDAQKRLAKLQAKLGLSATAKSGK